MVLLGAAPNRNVLSSSNVFYSNEISIAPNSLGFNYWGGDMIPIIASVGADGVYNPSGIYVPSHDKTNNRIKLWTDDGGGVSLNLVIFVNKQN